MISLFVCYVGWLCGKVESLPGVCWNELEHFFYFIIFFIVLFTDAAHFQNSCCSVSFWVLLWLKCIANQVTCLYRALVGIEALEIGSQANQQSLWTKTLGSDFLYKNTTLIGAWHLFERSVLKWMVLFLLLIYKEHCVLKCCCTLS